MKNRALIGCLVVLALAYEPLVGQIPNIPTRNQLAEDVFGSYIDVTLVDSLHVSGELIGMRNDSIIILSTIFRTVDPQRVSRARVIVHLPNNYYPAGILLMSLSGLVMIQGAEYPEAIGLGMVGILLNGIGLASAQVTENKKVNYYDWSEGWQKVMAYSRFPHGIPANVKLSELKGRGK